MSRSGQAGAASGGGGGGAGPGGFEPRDIAVGTAFLAGAILLAAIGLVVVGISAAVWPAAGALRTPAVPGASAVTSLASDLPPDPGSPAYPIDDWRRSRAEQLSKIDGYGWEDRSAGVARIPVRRAIDLIAAAGLPSRPNAPMVREPFVRGGAAGAGEPSGQDWPPAPAAGDRPEPTGGEPQAP
jgi:hypothetical protein